MYITDKIFNNLTKKDNEYIQFLKSRIGSHVPKDIAKQMIEFALSKEQSLLAQNQIEQDCFYKKKPVQNPIAHIVLSQTGGGKTQVTKQLLKRDNNIICIDSDIYKKYNPLKEFIFRNYPTHFGYLTGIDCYLHRDYIYNKAIKEKYNILIELPPSTTQGLFNVDIDFLIKSGYNVVFHILAVSNINSLLSIHERYENQLAQNYDMPKLTDLNRALDSFEAMDKTLQELLKNNKINIKMYKRNPCKLAVINIACNKQEYLTTFRYLQKNDYNITIPTIKTRIKILQDKMQQRNAPQEEIEQLQKIIQIINKNY